MWQARGAAARQPRFGPAAPRSFESKALETKSASAPAPRSLAGALLSSAVMAPDAVVDRHPLFGDQRDLSPSRSRSRNRVGAITGAGPSRSRTSSSPTRRRGKRDKKEKKDKRAKKEKQEKRRPKTTKDRSGRRG